MSNELIKTTQTALAQPVTEKMIRDFLFGSNTTLTEQQQTMFMNIAVVNNLNPFKREIYCIKYGQEFNIVTDYKIPLARAEASGKLIGWHVELIKDGNKTTGARLTIHRKDFEHPFIWEVSMSEFNKQRANWKESPDFMIKKTCIGQGFRLAFPNENSSLPYLEAEVAGIDINDNNNNAPQIEMPKSKSETTSSPASQEQPAQELPEQDPGQQDIEIATPQQCKAIHTIVNNHNKKFKDDTSRQIKLEFILQEGHAVTSAKQLTKDQASALIGDLSQLARTKSEA